MGRACRKKLWTKYLFHFSAPKKAGAGSVESLQTNYDAAQRKYQVQSVKG